jgi:rubredoxin
MSFFADRTIMNLTYNYDSYRGAVISVGTPKLRKKIMTDFQCTLCEAKFDGEWSGIFLNKPDKCPDCGTSKSNIRELQREPNYQRVEQQRDYEQGIWEGVK